MASSGPTFTLAREWRVSLPTDLLRTQHTDRHACIDCNSVLRPQHPRAVTRGLAGPMCESPRMGF